MLTFKGDSYVCFVIFMVSLREQAITGTGKKKTNSHNKGVLGGFRSEVNAEKKEVRMKMEVRGHGVEGVAKKR